MSDLTVVSFLSRGNILKRARNCFSEDLAD